jgi:hypothetical protein
MTKPDERRIGTAIVAHERSTADLIDAIVDRVTVIVGEHQLRTEQRIIALEAEIAALRKLILEARDGPDPEGGHP